MNNSGRKGGRTKKRVENVFFKTHFEKEQDVFNKPIIRQKEPLKTLSKKVVISDVTFSKYN